MKPTPLLRIAMMLLVAFAAGCGKDEPTEQAPGEQTTRTPAEDQAGDTAANIVPEETPDVETPAETASIPTPAAEPAETATPAAEPAGEPTLADRATEAARDAAVKKASEEASKRVGEKVSETVGEKAGAQAEQATRKAVESAAGGTSPEADAAEAAAKTEAADAAATADSAAPAGKIATPWNDAKVGWMARYKMPNNMTMVQEVVEMNDQAAVVQQKMIMMGNEMPGQKQNMPRYVARPEGVATQQQSNAKKIKDETVTISGNDLACEVWEMETEIPQIGKQVTRTWTCKELPFGAVKAQTRKGDAWETTMELVELKMD